MEYVVQAVLMRGKMVLIGFFEEIKGHADLIFFLAFIVARKFIGHCQNYFLMGNVTIIKKPHPSYYEIHENFILMFVQVILIPSQLDKKTILVSLRL